jgi:hypothetical protein
LVYKRPRQTIGKLRHTLASLSLSNTTILSVDVGCYALAV